ncbi:MAG: hypothetical protein WCE44_15315 [Candidatus Velthaea sp.]
MRLVATALALAGALLGLAAPRCFAATVGGTSLVNIASATYSDAASRHYATVSNPVVATVDHLSAIVVNPKQPAANPASDGTPAGTPVTRTFTITNDSNITDAYQIDQLSAGSLPVGAVNWMTPAGPLATGVNGSLSPAVAPGASISVQVTIATTGLPLGQTVAVTLGVHTTVTGTANGIVRDTGKQWIIGATGPSLSGPSGSNTQVGKSVNASTVVQSQPGETVTFSISLTNTGGSAATGVVISDPVPATLSIVDGSAQINGVPAGSQAVVTGQTIAFTIPTLGSGATLVASFQTTLPPGATLGSSFVNVASVAAQGVAAAQTTPATVLAGQADVIFDGFNGGTARIGSATVTLLGPDGKIVKIAGPATSNSKARSTLASVIGNTANPFITGPDGAYGFAITGAQIGKGGRYQLTIAAANYLNRRIALDISPGVEGQLYSVVQTALDDQPLAAAGRFSLTRQNVSLENVFGVFGNLPIFPQRTITVTKDIDKQAAAAGDALVYHVNFENQSQYPIGATTIVDTLPGGMVYIGGSGRFDGKVLDPVVSGRTLTWPLATLPTGASHQITYAATILGSVAPGTNLTNAVAVTGTIPGTTAVTSSNATVTVLVLDGPFSPRRVVTGRVFVDLTGRGHFARGDTPVAGVRVVLEDGSYAITDAQGQFSFPSVRPGAHVLRLDPLTLPHTVLADPAVPMNSIHATQRLLHGVLDDGTMDDVQFSLVPAK